MKYVITGFGKFGRIALERLKNAHPDVEVLVIEKDNKVAGEVPKGIMRINHDAADTLAKSTLFGRDDIIIPMVPFNLAASFILKREPDYKFSDLPETISAMLPNPYIIDRSNIACSRSDFLCPDDCSEGDSCTVTGLPRIPLYEDLEKLSIRNCNVVVQRSTQILPGVGGYLFSGLLELSQRMAYGANIVATSCKCHAILTSMEKTKAP